MNVRYAPFCHICRAARTQLTCTCDTPICSRCRLQACPTCGASPAVSDQRLSIAAAARIDAAFALAGGNIHTAAELLTVVERDPSECPADKGWVRRVGIHPAGPVMICGRCGGAHVWIGGPNDGRFRPHLPPSDDSAHPAPALNDETLECEHCHRQFAPDQLTPWHDGLDYCDACLYEYAPEPDPDQERAAREATQLDHMIEDVLDAQVEPEVEPWEEEQ